MVIILGLQLEINAEQYEYVSELTDEAGIRVFIGTQNVMPFPYELGISVAPGYSTGVMLRKVNVTSEGLCSNILDNSFIIMCIQNISPFVICLIPSANSS